MSDITMYITALIGIVVVAGGFAVYKYGTDHFRTEEGKKDLLGILKGILMAVMFGLLMAGISLLSGCSQGTWMNNASVYTGLDYTKDVSTACDEGNGNFDDRSTSNLGIRANVYQFENFSANAKYTHHSCAFGTDSEGYDALGVELEYQFWTRK